VEAVSPRASKSEPTTRAGIIAAGLVRIVATPAELNAAGGWWSAEKPSDYPADVKRARSEGLRTGLPHWLRPPVTPKQAAAKMSREADSERRAACQYIGDKTYTPPSQMTPTQLRSALGTQQRRLSGGWGDAGKGLDVDVSPPDAATIELLPAVTPAVQPEQVEVATVPEVSAVVPESITLPASEPEPVLVAAPMPAAEPVPPMERAPEPIAVPVAIPEPRSPERPRLPTILPAKPAPEPTPARYQPAGRDRLAWVPLMQRLAAIYAKRGLQPRYPNGRGGRQ
jgi:hypothetical protein